MLRDAGFSKVKVVPKDSSRSFIREWLPGKSVEDYLVSATIEAIKPRDTSLVTQDGNAAQSR